MKKSGAWWRIPLNNGECVIKSPEDELQLMSVGDYVSKYSQSIEGSYRAFWEDDIINSDT